MDVSNVNFSDPSFKSSININVLEKCLAVCPLKGLPQCIVGAVLAIHNQCNKPEFSEYRVKKITHLSKEEILNSKIEFLVQERTKYLAEQKEYSDKISNVDLFENSEDLKPIRDVSKSFNALPFFDEDWKKNVESIKLSKFGLEAYSFKKSDEKTPKSNLLSSLTDTSKHVNVFLSKISSQLHEVFEEPEFRNQIYLQKKLKQEISTLWDNFKSFHKDRLSYKKTEVYEVTKSLEEVIKWKIRREKSLEIFRNGTLSMLFPVIAEIPLAIWIFKKSRVREAKEQNLKIDRKSKKLVKPHIDGEALRKIVNILEIILQTGMGIPQFCVALGLWKVTKEKKPDINRELLNKYLNKTPEEILEKTPHEIASLIGELKSEKNKRTSLYIASLNGKFDSNIGSSINIDNLIKEIASKAFLNPSWEKVITTPLYFPDLFQKSEKTIPDPTETPREKMLATEMETKHLLLLESLLNQMSSQTKKDKAAFDHLSKVRKNLKNLTSSDMTKKIKNLNRDIKQLNELKKLKAQGKLMLAEKALKSTYNFLEKDKPLRTLIFDSVLAIGTIKKIVASQNQDPQYNLEFKNQATQKPSELDFFKAPKEKSPVIDYAPLIELFLKSTILNDVKKLKEIHGNYVLASIELNEKPKETDNLNLNKIESKITELESKSLKTFHLLNLSIIEINASLTALKKNPKIQAFAIKAEEQVVQLKNSRNLSRIRSELYDVINLNPPPANTMGDSATLIPLIESKNLQEKLSSKELKKEEIKTTEEEICAFINNLNSTYALDHEMKCHLETVLKTLNFLKSYDFSFWQKRVLKLNKQFSRDELDLIISSRSHAFSRTRLDKIQNLRKSYESLKKHVDPQEMENLLSQLNEIEEKELRYRLVEKFNELNLLAEPLREKLAKRYYSIVEPLRNDIFTTQTKFEEVNRYFNEFTSANTQIGNQVKEIAEISALIDDLSNTEEWRYEVLEALHFLQTGALTIIPGAGVVVGLYGLYKDYKEKKLLKMVSELRELGTQLKDLQEQLEEFNKKKKKLLERMNAFKSKADQKRKETGNSNSSKSSNDYTNITKSIEESLKLVLKGDPEVSLESNKKRKGSTDSQTSLPENDFTKMADTIANNRQDATIKYMQLAADIKIINTDINSKRKKYKLLSKKINSMVNCLGVGLGELD